MDMCASLASDITGCPARPSRASVAGQEPSLIGEMAGEYRLERVIGLGGMATVYAARHPVIGKQAAVKVMHSYRGSDPALLRRFVDEARAVNRIHDPHVVDIFALGRFDFGPHFLVMELLQGETLAQRLERAPLPSGLGCRLLAQAATAVAAAHRVGIVHRDLKPQNLFIVQRPGAAPNMKVLDFGVAKLLADSAADSHTTGGVAIGTPHFMAPEQCLGERVNAAADTYALGVILYRMFAGRLPFEGESFAEIFAQHVCAAPVWTPALRDLPAVLQQLIDRCLQKSPAARPTSCEEVSAQLLACAADLDGRSGVGAYRSVVLPKAGASERSSRMRRTGALLGVGAALALCSWTFAAAPAPQLTAPATSSDVLRGPARPGVTVPVRASQSRKPPQESPQMEPTRHPPQPRVATRASAVNARGKRFAPAPVPIQLIERNPF